MSAPLTFGDLRAYVTSNTSNDWQPKKCQLSEFEKGCRATASVCAREDCAPYKSGSDTRTAEFRLEAHRQSRAVARSPVEREDQIFIDAVSDLSEE
jgi:hypothetical protein